MHTYAVQVRLSQAETSGHLAGLDLPPRSIMAQSDTTSVWSGIDWTPPHRESVASSCFCPSKPRWLVDPRTPGQNEQKKRGHRQTSPSILTQNRTQITISATTTGAMWGHRLLPALYASLWGRRSVPFRCGDAAGARFACDAARSTHQPTLRHHHHRLTHKAACFPTAHSRPVQNPRRR